MVYIVYIYIDGIYTHNVHIYHTVFTCRYAVYLYVCICTHTHIDVYVCTHICAHTLRGI